MTEEEEIVSEASPAVKAKRKAAEDLVLGLMDTVDKTGENSATWRTKFAAMSDVKFDAWARAFAADPQAHFYMRVEPYKNEPTLRDIKAGADMLGVPLEEYVYYKHPGGEVVRSRDRCPVGFLHIKRLQQVLSKKNSYSLDISSRNQKTGQVTGESRIARISDSENYALTVMGADFALKELLGARADNSKTKLAMYQQIATEGYFSQGSLPLSEAEESQTLSTVATYFMGAGIQTDLLSPDLALPRTNKARKARQSTAQRMGAS